MKAKGLVCPESLRISASVEEIFYYIEGNHNCQFALASCWNKIREHYHI